MKILVNGVEFERCNTVLASPDGSFLSSQQQMAGAWAEVYMEVTKYPEYSDVMADRLGTGLQDVINTIRYLKANQKEI